jgi:cytochrome c-type biogenesis protein CcsB
MRLLIYSVCIFYLCAFTAVILYHLKKRGVFEQISRVAILLGFLLHTTALGLRSYEAGHAPILSMYETLLFYSWCTILVTIIVLLRYNECFTRLITIPLALTALIFAQINVTPAKPLTLILKTRWFETHVITSFAAYALFTLAFSAAVLYLSYDLYTRRPVPGRPYNNPEGEPLKYLRDFQDIINRSTLWGFFLFSFSMFAGAVWAHLAWGTYWLWEPKVLWSFIIWFYYTGAIHIYYIKEWRGRGLAIATITGYIIVLFTYLGVSLLMKSSHSF